MSIIDNMTEERFFQLLRDIRALSDESFEHLISDLKRTGKLPKHHDDEPRQLQLVLMIDQTLADNNDNKHKNN